MKNKNTILYQVFDTLTIVSAIIAVLACVLSAFCAVWWSIFNVYSEQIQSVGSVSSIVMLVAISIAYYSEKIEEHYYNANLYKDKL